MSKAIIHLFLILILICPLCVTGQNQPSCNSEAGFVNWKDWKINWELGFSGLEIKQVYYKNKKVIYSASMPGIRVQGVNNSEPQPGLCGIATTLRFNRGNARDWDCGNCLGKVCVGEVELKDKFGTWLSIGAMGFINGLHIQQVWYFNDSGQIHPRVNFRGTNCPQVSHFLHFYFRIDFDVDGADNDQILAFGPNRNSVVPGLGKGFTLFPNEVNYSRSPGWNDLWMIRDAKTTNSILVFSNNGDGTTPTVYSQNSFADKDMPYRRWHSDEVPGRSWPKKITASHLARYQGNVDVVNGENIDAEDNVLWYIAHARGIPDLSQRFIWRSIGPTFQIWKWQ